LINENLFDSPCTQVIVHHLDQGLDLKAKATKFGLKASLPVDAFKEKRCINKKVFCYISRICPEAPRAQISTIFGMCGRLAIVTNFVVTGLGGFDSVGVSKLSISLFKRGVAVNSVLALPRSL